MYPEIQKEWQSRLNSLVDERENLTCGKLARKQKLAESRNSEIVKVKGFGKIVSADGQKVHYKIHLKYLMKQGEHFYFEEEIEQRIARIDQGCVIEDAAVVRPEEEAVPEDSDLDSGALLERVPFYYDRLKAVQYAERWWNSHNPDFPHFPVDCTNYISQCLHAGGAPMRGFLERGKGWWMRQKNWSYSWTVAHAFKWYLASSATGLRAKEMPSAEMLQPGDVICYDFQGDGRFDHSTIVTAMDANGQPLVNAHTTNSRMRYWSYEDSTAYTENIKYKFYSIQDDRT
ncbi:hypothetical protein JOC78_000600 [Bacillus ectoiniformans]|uniref:amidase domain-containing protein n=1 Tax=Bacillus ectoiniformans TaxID=1494429 RepID=UPI0019560289|nr:amidase domain-containing protein [Bacillus ectoiniformans]MBM7647679.1 hypothetical protein [Bacillus ectoiniformans]